MSEGWVNNQPIYYYGTEISASYVDASTSRTVGQIVANNFYIDSAYLPFSKERCFVGIF